MSKKEKYRSEEPTNKPCASLIYNNDSCKGKIS